LDTKGPEIRTGDVVEDLLYSKDEQFSIVVDPSLADESQKILFCDYPYLIEDVAIGDSIMIDSGNLIVTVEAKEANQLIVKAANDAKI
jgi:pyruvate kinase